MSFGDLISPDLLTGFDRPVQVFFADLLLAGDNALAIALFCQALPPALARRAVAYGTMGAICLRIILAFLVSSLLALPGVKIIGALLLLVIAANLVAPREDSSSEGRFSALRGGGIFAIGITIAVIDVIMSLDNVLALVAVARGSLVYLAIGVAASIPLLMTGTLAVARLLRRQPWLIDCGGAVLGWIAGAMLLGDPLVANYAATQAPALSFLLPGALALFVFQLGWGVERGTAELAPVAVAVRAPVEFSVPRVVRRAPVPKPLLLEDDIDEPEPDSPPRPIELYAFLGLALVAGIVIMGEILLNNNYSP
jgi:YjbE family integral membrane protein